MIALFRKIFNEDLSFPVLVLYVSDKNRVFARPRIKHQKDFGLISYMTKKGKTQRLKVSFKQHDSQKSIAGRGCIKLLANSENIISH